MKLESHLYFGDYIVPISECPDNCFDLAIEDPEYGIGESSKDHKSRNTPILRKGRKNILRAPRTLYIPKKWDKEPPADEYFNQIFRVSKNQIIWGANYFKQLVGNPFSPPRRTEYEDFIKRFPIGYIIWDKCNGNSDFSDCEVAWTSFKQPSFVYKLLWNGMLQAKSLAEPEIQQGNKRLNEKRYQPGQKPVLINKYLLQKYANPGDIILDSHSGSGSSRIAAFDYGCHWYGCENDFDNYCRQQKRYDNHIAQQRLF